jgi:hypothetical protein
MESEKPPNPPKPPSAPTKQPEKPEENGSEADGSRPTRVVSSTPLVRQWVVDRLVLASRALARKKGLNLPSFESPWAPPSLDDLEDPPPEELN